jgi:hypothetical protein
MVAIFSANDSLSLAGVRFVDNVFGRVPESTVRKFRERALGGHVTVRTSLTKGLRLIGQHVSLNPAPEELQGLTSGVLAGRKLARDLLKFRGRIALGPNLVVSPREDPDLFVSPIVETVIVPSRWVKLFYAQELPEIESKLVVWSSGVDTRYWSPGGRHVGPPRILIYAKNKEREVVQKTTQALRRLGVEWEVIEYGKYNSSDYLKSLRNSSAVVFLGGSESQGLAQFEAWSVGLPTFVMQELTNLDVQLGTGGAMTIARGDWSAAPYLDSQNGLFWSEWEDLTSLCNDLIGGRLEFAPRDFVLENHTLELSAELYLRAIGGR